MATKLHSILTVFVGYVILEFGRNWSSRGRFIQKPPEDRSAMAIMVWVYCLCDEGWAAMRDEFERLWFVSYKNILAITFGVPTWVCMSRWGALHSEVTVRSQSMIIFYDHDHEPTPWYWYHTYDHEQLERHQTASWLLLLIDKQWPWPTLRWRPHLHGLFTSQHNILSSSHKFNQQNDNVDDDVSHHRQSRRFVLLLMFQRRGNICWILVVLAARERNPHPQLSTYRLPIMLIELDGNIRLVSWASMSLLLRIFCWQW